MLIKPLFLCWYLMEVQIYSSMRGRLCTLQKERIKIRVINRNESTSTPESIKERALKLRHIDLLSDIFKLKQPVNLWILIFILKTTTFKPGDLCRMITVKRTQINHFLFFRKRNVHLNQHTYHMQFWNMLFRKHFCFMKKTTRNI